MYKLWYNIQYQGNCIKLMLTTIHTLTVIGLILSLSKIMVFFSATRYSTLVPVLQFELSHTLSSTKPTNLECWIKFKVRPVAKNVCTNNFEQTKHCKWVSYWKGTFHHCHRAAALWRQWHLPLVICIHWREQTWAAHPCYRANSEHTAGCSGGCPPDSGSPETNIIKT